MITHINDSNFEQEVLNEDKLVLVDFSAAWCGPCKMLSPILEQISTEVKNVKIAKLDVDESPRVSNKYQIQNIPAIKIFKAGKVVDESIGFLPKEQLAAIINKNL